jgi:heptose I phosphotransferase
MSVVKGSTPSSGYSSYGASGYIAPELKSFEPDVDSLFDALGAVDGEIFRQVESRRTFRFSTSSNLYFAKLHYGVGWREIVKNLLQFKLPIIGAQNEYDALQLLENAGVPVPKVVGFASYGLNPATRRSCIVTKSLINTLSLEDFCRQKRVTPSRKHVLIARVADLTQQMHEAGVNHRDCYICHFHLQLEEQDKTKPTLFVIDLHRAQIREHTPIRWRVKDVGSLLFSAIEEDALRKNDFFRFMKVYSGKPLRQSLLEDGFFWRKVMVRARKLYLKKHSQLPPLLM